MRCSIVIPAYNEEQTIGACIEGLLNQSYPRGQYEIIVVDDGSTDGTRRLLERYPITVLHQQNRGPAQARNWGVSSSRGEIVLFTDADCEPDPHWVEEMLRPFENPAVAGVKGIYRTRQRELTARFAQLEFEDRYDKLAGFETIDFVDSHSAAFRRSVFLEAGGFDPHFPVANNEDVDLSYKIAEKGHRMAFTQKAIVYHQHPSRLKEYLQIKFLRGYWRMMVYRRFPRKVLSDTYTPQTLKLQIVLAGLAWLAVGTLPLWPSAWVALATVLAAFVATTLPMMLKSLKRDFVAALLVPGFIFLRSTVFIFGVIAGMLARSRGDLLWPTLFLANDVLMIALAYAIAYELRVKVLAGMLPAFDYSFRHLLALLPAVTVIWVCSLASLGLYHSKRTLSMLMEYLQVVKGTLLALLSTAAVGFFLKYDYSRSLLVLHSMIGVGFLAASRSTIRDLERHLLKKGYQSIRVLILGCGEAGILAARRIRHHPELGFNLIGFVVDASDLAPPPEGLPALGSSTALREIIRRESIDEVFIARTDMSHQDLLELMADYDGQQVVFKVVSDIFEIITNNISLSSAADVAVVELKTEPEGPVRRATKRAFDIAASLLMLPFAAPFGLLVFLLLKRQYPGKSPFQTLSIIGQNGGIVDITLFRDPFQPGKAGTNGSSGYGRARYWESRVQRFLLGRRLYHLPLLLWQVLRGEISLVGHKADIAERLPEYSSWDRKRLLMKPGISGLWLVIDPSETGRTATEYYDFYYLKHQSFLLDALILMKTIPYFLVGFPTSDERRNAFDQSPLYQISAN